MQLQYYTTNEIPDCYPEYNDLIKGLPFNSLESYKYCAILPQSIDNCETVQSIMDLIKDINCRIVLINLSRLHSTVLRNAYANVYNEFLSDINFIEFVNKDIRIPYELHLYFKPEGI